MKPLRKSIELAQARLGATCHQYAALPYRVDAAGRREVLLVTTRATRRWIIPKGWPVKDMKPHLVAACEAFEEAGVAGRIGRKPLGSFEYWKRLDASFALCEVTVFPLEVGHVEADWREAGMRERRWCSLAEALDLVEEPGLLTLLQRFAETQPDNAPVDSISSSGNGVGS